MIEQKRIGLQSRRRDHGVYARPGGEPISDYRKQNDKSNSPAIRQSRPETRARLNYGPAGELHIAPFPDGATEMAQHVFEPLDFLPAGRTILHMRCDFLVMATSDNGRNLVFI